MLKSYLAQLEDARTAAKGSILMVGTDHDLQHSRTLLFSSLKIPVQTVKGESEVYSLPTCSNFCLVALDLSTLQSRAAALAAYIRTRWPAAKVLLLGLLPDDLDDPLYDDIVVVDPKFNPAGVVEASKRLLKDLRPDLMTEGNAHVEE